MTITTDVENYPGFSDVVQGPWLMEEMRDQAKKVGTKIILDTIIDVDLSKRPFILKSDSDVVYSCDSLIISTGAQAKWLGLESEAKYKGYGVSACATCDGFFYKDKKVVVVGGGNTAVEEALFLTNFAKKVTLIHRRKELRAEKILQKKLFDHPKIEVIWDSEIKEILGSDNPPSVENITVRNMISNAESQIDVDGVFIAIGHSPSSKIFKDKLKISDTGYILTDPDSTATSITGVFAAGDVTDDKYRQAVTAAGMGCMAALEVESLLSSEES
jgi:thioredoxin reductase (NADPH)